MPTSERLLVRAGRAADRQAREAGAELREQRLALGLSQEHVARASRIARNRYGRIEHGRCPTVTLPELNATAAVLGLSLAVRMYPAGPAVRDVAHATKLERFLEPLQEPLTFRLEVALPSVEGRLELRAWDVVLFGEGLRTSIELEMRLRDVQALRRRIDLKRRDDPTDRFLLLVADTRTNRRTLADFGTLFADLPRLRPSRVRRDLAAGRHPATGLLLV